MNIHAKTCERGRHFVSDPRDTCVQCRQEDEARDTADAVIAAAIGRIIERGDLVGEAADGTPVFIKIRREN